MQVLLQIGPVQQIQYSLDPTTKFVRASILLVPAIDLLLLIAIEAVEDTSPSFIL